MQFCARPTKAKIDSGYLLTQPQHLFGYQIATSSASTSISLGGVSLGDPWTLNGVTGGQKGFTLTTCGATWIHMHKPLTDGRSSGWSIAVDGMTENIDGLSTRECRGLIRIALL